MQTSVNSKLHIKKLVTQFLFLLIGVCILTIPTSRANEVDDIIPPPVLRFNYDIESGIEILFSPNLLNFFEHNLDTALEKNGVSPSSYYIYDYSQNTGEKTLDDLISNDRTLKSIKNIRYYFRKYFSGIRIRNTHDFNIGLKGIDLSANWKNFGMEVVQSAENKNKITVYINLEADRLSLNLDSLRISDNKHKFLKEIGGNKFSINLDQANSPNLSVRIPVEVETFSAKRNPGDEDLEFKEGSIKFKINEIETNIDEIKLNAGWSAPLVLPRVSISINGRTAYLRTNKIERAIKRQLPNMISGMQESLTKFFSENAPEMIEGKLNRRFKRGYLDMYKFEPFFAPDHIIERISALGEFDQPVYPNAYVLGLRFKNLGIKQGHLKIALDTFMEDGLDDHNYYEISASKAPYSSDVLERKDHDIATIINTDLINKYIKLSCDRGYFKKVDFGDDLIIKVPSCPYIYVHKNEKELRMKVEIEDNVKGFIESRVVRNPIRVKFEVGLSLVLSKNGLYTLKMNRLYENSLKIDNKYIKYKIFRKSVIKAAKKMLTNLNKTYENYVLYEGVPLPDTIGGIPLRNIGHKLDKNGYMILYMKTIL